MLLQRLRNIGVCAVLLPIFGLAFASGAGEAKEMEGTPSHEEGAMAFEVGMGVWAAANDEALGEVRGTGGTQLSLSELESNVLSNEVGDGVVTGDIMIQDAAFSEFSGVQAASFNTGNNVSLQNNVIVNIHLE